MDEKLELAAASLRLETRIHGLLGHEAHLRKLYAELQEPHPVYNRMVATYRFDPLEES